MRKIAVINQKGGVGKTTTSVNLAAALSEHGQRVLILDLDPQAHASLHLGIHLGEDDASVYDVMTQQSSVADAMVRITPKLALLPANINLAAAEMELASEVGREFILRDALGRSYLDLYDYIIVDCPPSLGLLTLNALTAVDDILLPMQPHYLALHGLSQLLQTTDLVAKRLNPDLRLAAVLLTMSESNTRLCAEVESDVSEFLQTASAVESPWQHARLLDTRIRKNIKLAEAPSFGQTIFQYAPDSNGACDYDRAAKEIEALARVDSESNRCSDAA
ncbi:MAG: AAA family ATPase [Pirellulales bacterium]|jgi:chromosome partitioning protein|nr:AAA family ATPase [Pirellulales bacterium]|tara:strand:+ start:132 stop:962 length:831 start_codon:yes stop_codon:yes gene_type:complete